jgi:exonuclease III
VSEPLQTAVKACFPLDHGEPDPRQLSDHCPLILEMDLEAAGGYAL